MIANLQKIEPISLGDMTKVKLMNRIDSKYLTTEDTLEVLLEMAAPYFLVQESDTGIRELPYHTVYFDTIDLRMYNDHQRGKKSRKKVRIREYVDSGVLPFLEIKNKDNKGRTKKKRISMESGDSLISYSEFISENSEYSVSLLTPWIENRFKRITLVNIERTERITIDTSVEFHNFVTGENKSLPRLVIIEWKRDSLSSETKLQSMLRSLHIRETGFSKYVVGMAMTDISLRQNRLKPKMRLIDKINIPSKLYIA